MQSEGGKLDGDLFAITIHCWKKGDMEGGKEGIMHNYIILSYHLDPQARIVVWWTEHTSLTTDWVIGYIFNLLSTATHAYSVFAATVIPENQGAPSAEGASRGGANSPMWRTMGALAAMMLEGPWGIHKEELVWKQLPPATFPSQHVTQSSSCATLSRPMRYEDAILFVIAFYTRWVLLLIHLQEIIFDSVILCEKIIIHLEN